MAYGLSIVSDIPVLFVDPRGPYPQLTTEWYDAARDARTYAGVSPVVAHPPCGPWGRLHHLCTKDDPSLAPWAVDLVRRVGGVLEHPADSKLWRYKLLPRPGELPDPWGGWAIEVCQVDWGHVARKRTWLYLVGVSWRALPPMPPPREPTHWIAGKRPRKGEGRRPGMIPEGIKSCSAQQRRRTPPAFAAWLLELAAKARPPRRRSRKISSMSQTATKEAGR